MLPEEYRSFMTPEREAAVRRFVEGGGRLAAWDASVMYAADILGLKLRNRAEGKTALEYNTHGSTLRVAVAETPYTAGMPRDALVLHMNAPIPEITERVHPERYREDVRFVREKVLESGLLVGEELLAGRPCMITAQAGLGEAVLYAFSPVFRAQTDGTYKLLFNTLYTYQK